jgi:hypothetical protein
MNTLSLQLPDSLVKGLNEACLREGFSINQFIALAIAEKLSALMTEEYLQKRKKRTESVKRHHQWHDQLDPEAFFNEVFKNN